MTLARKAGRGIERAVVGLVPAAGEASRVAPLPCSKELYPIGFRSVDGCKSTRPKVAAHYLLEKMRFAGITQIYIVLRKGKWDIPNYFGDGSMFDVNLAYLMMGLPFGTAYSLDQAYPFLPDAIVAFGFPDIVFSPADAYKKLLRRQATTGDDVVLGLFPAREPGKVDIVEVDHRDLAALKRTDEHAAGRNRWGKAEHILHEEQWPQMGKGQTGIFQDISAVEYTRPAFNLTGGSRPEQIRPIRVSADYFRLLGAPVMLGRTFTGDEDRPNGGRVIVLSYALWQRRFGGDHLRQ